jgi:hypothetical protein
MPSNDTGLNQRGGWPSGKGRIAFTVFLSAVLAIAAISSCRKEHPVPKNPGHQQAIVAQAMPARAQSKDERSCQEFVQGFYDWYINSHLSESHGVAWYDVPRLRPHSLSLELSNLLKKEDADQVKYQGIIHLDADPFLNSQDPSLKYSVESVAITNGRCLAVVKGSSEVRPELLQNSAGWAFTNFHYSFYSEDGKRKSYPDDDLIHMLKQPVGEPNKSDNTPR